MPETEAAEASAAAAPVAEVAEAPETPEAPAAAGPVAEVAGAPDTPETPGTPVPPPPAEPASPLEGFGKTGTPPLLVGGAGAAAGAGAGDAGADAGTGDVTPPPVPPAPPETPDDGHDDDGTDGTQRGGKGRKLLLALGGVVLVAIVGGLAWALLKDDDSSSGPEDAVREYFDAFQDANCDRLVELVQKETWSQGGQVTRKAAVKQCDDEFASQADFDIELDKVKVVDEKDDKATVEAKVTVGEESRTAQFDLVKEGGDWKLANL
jgi:hypothetical protein